MSEHEESKEQAEEEIEDLEIDPGSEEGEEIADRVRGGRAPIS